MCTFSDILLLICFFSENMILLLYYRIKIYLKLMFSQICLHIYDTFAHFSILYLRSSLLDHFSPTWSTLCGTLFSGDCLVTNHILFVYFFYLKYIYFSFILLFISLSFDGYVFQTFILHVDKLINIFPSGKYFFS